MITETNRLTVSDPLIEIRNGLYSTYEWGYSSKYFTIDLARLKVAPVWRRFIAETIDFVLLHILK